MKDLFELLPAVHRVRDAAQGDQLRALLAVITREVQRVEQDIAGLYDNWFIETCDEWVVPYIADLLGIRALESPPSGSDAVFSQRSYVANTLAYRRRKGTAAVLEQLAADITGWRCRAVEFFALTASAQHSNHPRPAHHFTADIRSSYANQFHDGPFDRSAHLTDVRHIDNGRGRYNAPNVGLFLWKLQSYLLADVEAARVDANRFTFDALGASVPLFNMPRTETTISESAQPTHVPMPIARYTLAHDRALYYGDDADARSLRISSGAGPVPVDDIVACNLDDSGTGWAHTPPAGQLAVDPELGRIAFGTAPAAPVLVSFAYGFGGDLGGGPYDRRASLEEPLARGVSWQMGVLKSPPPGQTSIVATLADAVKAWNQQPPGTSGAIVLMDSRRYEENLDSAATRIAIPEGSQLVIVASAWPPDTTGGAPVWRAGRFAPSGVRPHLKGAFEVIGTAPAGSASPGRLVMNGLLLEGSLTVTAGHLGALDLAHSTLVPGKATLACDANEALDVTCVRTITGAQTLPSVRTLRLREAIVIGDLQATDTVIDAVTVLGATSTKTLTASNSVFTGKVVAERRQEGCVRFSYLPLDSEPPRRYRCQPETAAQATRVRPTFESERYGDPALAQLASTCAAEIAGGADDDGEMGAWHFVQAPLRLRNLRRALDEYLRFGLEAGVVLVRQSPRHSGS